MQTAISKARFPQNAWKDQNFQTERGEAKQDLSVTMKARKIRSH
jgi:hypothetical protein